MKAGTKKGLAAAVAVGLAAVIGVGVWAGVTFGMKKGNSVDFGQNVQVTPSGGDGIMKLSVASVQNEDGKTVQEITATVEPEYATNAIVDWSIAWGETTGSWGSGSQGDISDYLTITPESDGALKAQVECLAPFGTQGVIEAHIRGYEEISDTCIVDFIQGYESASAVFGFVKGPSMEDPISWNLTGTAEQTVEIPAVDSFEELNSYGANAGTATATYSDVYTVASGAATMTVSLAYSEEYVAALAAAGITATANSYEQIGTSSSSNTVSMSKYLAEMLGLYGEDVSEAEFNAYRTYLIENASDVMLMIKIDVTSNEGVPGGTEVYSLKFSGIGSLATGLDLPDRIVFY